LTYASVYPLLTTRSLARPFTYTVEDGVGKGAVVQIRLGGARRRGVVVGLEDEPPPGVTVSAVERVVEELPPDLVELALWIADYYGSTPGRALGLVAPPRAKRRGERRAPAALGSLPGEAAPAALTPSQRAALERIAAGGGPFLLYGATGSGKTEVYLQAAAAELERGRGAIVLALWRVAGNLRSTWCNTGTDHRRSQG